MREKTSSSRARAEGSELAEGGAVVGKGVAECVTVHVFNAYKNVTTVLAVPRTSKVADVKAR